jgi:energy-coupling factor transport system permease protein
MMGEQQCVKSVAIHPYIILAWFINYLVVVFLFDHPLMLVGEMLLLFAIAKKYNYGRQLAQYMRIGVSMSFLILIANVLFVENGTTLIWQMVDVPLVGKLSVSMEALLYGLMMCLKLLIVTGLFALYNQMVSPERLIRLMKGKYSHIPAMVILSIRMMPLLMRDVKRVVEVQQLRGVDFEHGGMVKRIRAMFPLVGVVLQSSLERAFTMAESMSARGYGLSHRTALYSESFSRTDFLRGMVLMLSWVIIIGIKIQDSLSFGYYPVICGSLSAGTGVVVALTLIAIGLPVYRRAKRT